MDLGDKNIVEIIAKVIEEGKREEILLYIGFKWEFYKFKYNLNCRFVLQSPV